MSHQTMPLFDEPPPDGLDAQRRHLAAARRLSKRIGRLPDRSAQQTRTGVQICRHLVAMLKDIEAHRQRPH